MVDTLALPSGFAGRAGGAQRHFHVVPLCSNVDVDVDVDVHRVLVFCLVSLFFCFVFFCFIVCFSFTTTIVFFTALKQEQVPTNKKETKEKKQNKMTQSTSTRSDNKRQTMNRSRNKSRNRRRNKNKNNSKSKARTFKRSDYSSGDGFQTSVWGPLVWTALHTMSFNYPVHPTAKDKQHYKQFVYDLRHVLPCKYCRINLTKNLKTKPLQQCHLANRETFSRYIYELHELVNKMLNKKSNLTYCDVRERYEHFRSRCTEEKPRVFDFVKGTEKEKGKETTKEKGKGKEKEKGCVEPLYGKKSKCVINIVPKEDKSATFQIDKQCIRHR